MDNPWVWTYSTCLDPSKLDEMGHPEESKIGPFGGSNYPTYEFVHVQTNGSHSLEARETDPIRSTRGLVTTRSRTRRPRGPFMCGHGHDVFGLIKHDES